MANFLSGLGQGIGTLFGGPGNAGAASSNAWNYGQYSPFTVNNPAGSIGYDGTTANAGLSGPAAGLQTGLYGGANQGLGAAGGYNPNTSFLPQQYQQIFGNMQGNANSMFSSLQQAQAPWVQQGNASNLDNEFSKGTLASTAGSYQTAGHDTANNALMQQNQATAQQFALQKAQSQFGAAQGTAGLGEQQAEFGPQQGLGLLNSSMTGINNQNSFLNQLMQTSGNLGAQRSGANVAAATPGIETGNVQDNATAGLLSGLLFGGGSQGGLLQSLLGGSGGGGGGILNGIGSVGRGIGSLFGGGSGGGSGGSDNSWASVPGNMYGNSNYTGGGGDPSAWNQGNGDTSGDPSSWSSTGDGGLSSGDWWGNFNGAGGQAANGLQNIGVGNVSTLPSVQNAVNQGYQGGAGGILGNLGSAGGFLSGLSKGGASGYTGAALSAGQLYNNVMGHSNAMGGALGTAGSALGIYNGLTSGTASGYTNAAVNAAQLGAKAGAFGGASGAIGSAAGYAAIPLAIFNEAQSWQSGATGQDALGGAASGAAIGTAIMPGIGTAVGAILGAAGGAISSAFGNGKVDPENKPFEGYTQAFNKSSSADQQQIIKSFQDPYLPLAGYFDLRSNQLKGQNPIYSAYGRKGEEKFTNDLISKVHTAQQTKPGENPDQIFQDTVQPWIDSMGTWKDSNKNAMEGLFQNMTGQIMSGSYKQNFKAIGGQNPFANK